LQEDEDVPTICFKKLHDFEYGALREREREEEIDVREIERRGRRITECGEERQENLKERS
jgi:hypothetical protein